MWGKRARVLVWWVQARRPDAEAHHRRLSRERGAGRIGVQALAASEPVRWASRIGVTPRADRPMRLGWPPSGDRGRFLGLRPCCRERLAFGLGDLSAEHKLGDRPALTEHFKPLIYLLEWRLYN
jgi:hypothetical protein